MIKRKRGRPKLSDLTKRHLVHVKEVTVKTKPETIVNLSDVETAELLKQIQGRGYYIAKTPLQQSGMTFKVDLKRWAGQKFKFGVTSDTHMGSRYQQITHLHTFYRLCQKRGIDTVFHAGDLVDGFGIYRGQEFEVFVHGADAQTEYAVEHYPKYKGVKTVLISGNHDQSFMKTAGYNVAKAVCAEREDMTYIGDDLAFVNIDKIKIALMHGRAGMSYAKSYRLQKIMETMPSGPDKPHFLFLGHYHNSNILSGYRNMEGILMPCFQSQTPFEAALALSPTIAGLVVEFQIDDNGLARVVYEWIPFYVPVKNDF